MDALEFLRERKRMCNSYKDCEDCPLEWAICIASSTVPDGDYKRIIATVEQWSKEHPHKTRQSVFLEQWPNCPMDDDGVVGVCPRNVDKMYVCNLSRSGGCCTGCRREFWTQEVE